MTIFECLSKLPDDMIMIDFDDMNPSEFIEMSVRDLKRKYEKYTTDIYELSYYLRNGESVATIGIINSFKIMEQK